MYSALLSGAAVSRQDRARFLGGNRQMDTLAPCLNTEGTPFPMLMRAADTGRETARAAGALRATPDRLCRRTPSSCLQTPQTGYARNWPDRTVK